MPGEIPNVRMVAGLVVTRSGSLAVNVEGGFPAFWWPAGYIPTADDAVRVLMVDGVAQVLGPVTTGARPISGTVSGSASGGRVPVSTTAGTLQCRYAGTAPASGSLVFLDWQATTPRVMSNLSAEPEPAPDTPAAPKPAPAPAPAPAQSGSSVITAIDSGSYQVGGTWAWAGHTVYQYRYGSNRENRGAWFYGTRPDFLKGRTITKARLRVGGRVHVGSYNNTLTAHLYRHANRTRPGGDVSRTTGPHDVAIPPGGPSGGWIDIPASFGQQIVDSGGGIGLLAAPYLAFYGIDTDPASGQLELWWTR